MKILIIYAHPSQNSFCSSLKKQFIEGLQKNSTNDIRVHNLYKIRFDPIITKEEHYGNIDPDYKKVIRELQNDIAWSNTICLIYPVYWYNVPAILKGYFDRILTKGFAYEYDVDHPIPLLNDKKGIMIQTFDAEEKIEKELFEDVSYKSVYYTWKYCGVDDWIRKSMFRVNFVDNKKRKEWLSEIYALGESIH